ncbi:MAG: DMT family transporter [bacterium]
MSAPERSEAAGPPRRQAAEPPPRQRQATGPLPPQRQADGRLVLWMAFLTALWGLNAVFIKVLTLGMAPLMGAGLRGAIGLALLTGYGRLRGEKMGYRGQDLWHGLAVGGMFAAEFALFYLAAPLTTGGHIAIFINMAPFFVALGAHFFLPGERLTVLKILGLLLAFFGVVVLFSDELYVRQTGFWRGDLMVIAGAALWAGTTLYMKMFMMERFTDFRLLHVHILVSTPLLLGFSWLFEAEPFFAVTGFTVVALLFQAVVVVCFSYMMWMYLLRQYPAGSLQSFTLLTPGWGVAAGVALLGEAVSGLLLAGIALIGVGLYLVNRPAPRGHSPRLETH